MLKSFNSRARFVLSSRSGHVGLELFTPALPKKLGRGSLLAGKAEDISDVSKAIDIAEDAIVNTKVSKFYVPVDYIGETKVAGELRDISRKVYQRNDIDWTKIDVDSGLTNLELIKQGRSPISSNGSTIELHHLLHMEPGPMAEVPSSVHSKYHKILHGLVDNGGSFRNNPVLNKQYKNFRRKYWKWRYEQMK